MKTVLIDVDGTISNSMPGIRAGLLEALDSLGVPHPDEEFLATIAGPPMVETLAALGLSDEQVDAAFAVYMNQQRMGGWQMTSMYPQWPEILDGWRTDGLQLATATTKGEYFAAKVLEMFELTDCFAAIGAASNDGTRRQKADVIAYALAQLGIAAGPDVLMIGDRRHDIEGARAHGIDTVLVSWGYGLPEEHAMATAVVHSPEELDAYVRQWAGLPIAVQSAASQSEGAHA
ncbi:HAD-IA family hydrolase [Corynebacterium ulceribovis]|uniref:HAD-IA family hydrolase n=1 Tax=Corynebacterium ulceribovis TaxID=487732 RepID=UPI000365DC32|nr:HAD-IA family hydrolase [Corynebacterium ulceribovis]